MLVLLLNTLLPAAASFVGAWLAARFALHRFSQEKIWERKLAAYTVIFEAIHDMDRWFTVQRTLAIMKGASLPPEEEQKLKNAYDEAESLLRRRLAAETWLIPETIASRIERGLQELSGAGEIDDWLHYMHEGVRVMSTLMTDLRAAVRADMRIRTFRLPFRIFTNTPSTF
jgi:hypothetical protein